MTVVHGLPVPSHPRTAGSVGKTECETKGDLKIGKERDIQGKCIV